MKHQIDSNTNIEHDTNTGHDLCPKYKMCTCKDTSTFKTPIIIHLSD